MKYDDDNDNQFEEIPTRAIDWDSCPIHILKQYLEFAPKGTEEFKTVQKYYNKRTGVTKGG